jgi:hypothetical protein
MIGYLPAARMGDMATCVGPPDVIVKGSPTVFINGRPAARMLDTTAHGGTIVMGCFTVIIGDGGGGSAGGGGGGAGGVGNASVKSAQAGGAEETKGAGKGGGAATGGAGKKPKRDGFATQDEAARAALEESNPKSIKDNREYGGYIYKDRDGTYGYTKPIKGSEDGVDLGKTSVPAGKTEVGNYHTHGDYSIIDPKTGKIVRTSDPKRDDFDSDNFSQPDIDTDKVMGAGKPGYRGYLGTPSGVFKYNEPGTGTQGTI